jgi:transposase
MTSITTTPKNSLFMALELSNKNWKISLSNGEKLRNLSVPAGDLEGLRVRLQASKEKLGVSADCPVWSCYEAGRDGFWIHRALTNMGVKNVVVDPASIEVSRRRKHLKTDRLDAEKLVRMLMRYTLYGEKTVWRVVVIPTEEQEDARRLHREQERLKKERTGHLNRIRGLLMLHGVRLGRVERMDVSVLRDWQGQPLGAALREELQREQARLVVVNEQIAAIEVEQTQRLRKPSTQADVVAVKLQKFKGIGPISAWVLSQEVFGWRHFENRRQVGSMAGLTGTAYASGDTTVEQGISKAGNRRVRSTMIELAWRWTWYQPQSELTIWYQQRFGSGGKRLRRIGIVALARKLLIALWKYLETGEVPVGARLGA